MVYVFIKLCNATDFFIKIHIHKRKVFFINYVYKFTKRCNTTKIILYKSTFL